MRMGDVMQSADWKSEKHVPVIECPDSVHAGEPFEVRVLIGKEIPHPNTTEHHIRWLSLYFKPEDEQYTVELGKYGFEAHGESVLGPNKGSAYADPSILSRVKLQKSGTLLAEGYCNIHGLWENGRKITVS